MKKIFTLLLTCAFASMLNAQLADGSIAPDFTLTDINGVEHSLYEDYLDQGYTVVIDMSATWCGPCWSYHESHALADLYTNHGPAGMPGVSDDTTDDMMVFYLEADDSTTQADLEGTGGSTTGDWITGTPYPIIDNAESTADDYAIAYYPTIYTVCPGGITSETGQISADAHYEFSDINCASAVHTSDSRIVQLDADNYYCGEFAPNVIIQNLGNGETLTSATITASQYGNIMSSVNWTGSLETYQTEAVTLPGFANIDGNEALIFTVISAGDMDSSNDVREMTVSQAVTSETVEVQLLTDNYGEETSWDITDPDGNIIASGSGYVADTEYSETVELLNVGCFKLNVYDAYGDGMCCTYGEGYFKLIDQWGNEIASGGEFASETGVPFKNSVASSISETSIDNEISLFPNPANDNVTINFNAGNGNSTNLEILNTVGEVVYSEYLGSVRGTQNIVLNVAELSSGLYFVSVSNEEFKTTQELSIIK